MTSYQTLVTAQLIANYFVGLTKEMMNNDHKQSFSEVLNVFLKRTKYWVTPDPNDHIALTIIKTIFKSIVILLALLFSPVIIIGFALIFIGLM